jgi:hypothetical protein
MGHQVYQGKKFFSTHTHTYIYTDKHTDYCTFNKIRDVRATYWEKQTE